VTKVDSGGITIQTDANTERWLPEHYITRWRSDGIQGVELSEKIDAVPGITTSLRVTPTRLGTYPAGLHRAVPVPGTR
jgi:hypothetical protein